jgi:hypothetical protein
LLSFASNRAKLKAARELKIVPRLCVTGVTRALRLQMAPLFACRIDLA